MLCADFMISSDKRTLEQRPCAFHAIGRDVAAHLFFFVMVNRFMPECFIQSLICRRFIGHDSRFFINTVFNNAFAAGGGEFHLV